MMNVINLVLIVHTSGSSSNNISLFMYEFFVNGSIRHVHERPSPYIVRDNLVVPIGYGLRFALSAAPILTKDKVIIP